MKIGILTLPIRVYNYGGMLQTYALSKYLQNIGHEVIILNRTFPEISRFRKLTNFAKRFILKLIFNKKVFISKRPYKKIISNHEIFFNKYLTLSKPLRNSRDLKTFVLKNRLDAIVVGSDQVWRDIYSPDIKNYFLDFCLNLRIKRLSYAASFGIDKWELSDEKTEICKQLIKKFDAVSVRELSGITLCKTHLGINAQLMPDPTLLFAMEDYDELIASFETLSLKGNLFIYFIDDNEEYKRHVENIVKKLRLNPFSLKPQKKFSNIGIDKSELPLCSLPSIAQWLNAFKQAEYILTDSFHGCIFSIIFKRPFLVMMNENRGISRINSLLKLFNLEDRLISGQEEINTLALKEINWEKINEIKQELKQNCSTYFNILK